MSQFPESITNGLLRYLSLESEYTGKVDAEVIVDLIRRYATIKGVDLNGMTLDDEGAKKISEILKENTTVKELNLDGCKIGDQGFAAILQGLENNETVSNIIVGDAVSPDLRKKFNQHMQKITELKSKAGEIKTAIKSLMELKQSVDLLNGQLLSQHGRWSEIVTQHAVTDIERSIAAKVIVEPSNITLADICGLAKEKSRIEDVIATIKKSLPTKLRRAPRGILLFGPSGTGKTSIAKAISNSLDRPFLSFSSGEFQSKYIGEAEKRVKALFDIARRVHESEEKVGIVVFIDEVENIFGKREEKSTGVNVLQEFLAQWSGYHSVNGSILLICATNKKELLDEAALTRFEEQIEIPLPDGPAVHEIMLQLLSEDVHELTLEEINDFACQFAAMTHQDKRKLSAANVESILIQAAMKTVVEAPDQEKIVSIKANHIKSIISGGCYTVEKAGTKDKARTPHGDTLTKAEVTKKLVGWQRKIFRTKKVYVDYSISCDKISTKRLNEILYYEAYNEFKQKDKAGQICCFALNLQNNKGIFTEIGYVEAPQTAQQVKRNVNSPAQQYVDQTTKLEEKLGKLERTIAELQTAVADKDTLEKAIALLSANVGEAVKISLEASGRSESSSRTGGNKENGSNYQSSSAIILVLALLLGVFAMYLNR